MKIWEVRMHTGPPIYVETEDKDEPVMNFDAHSRRSMLTFGYGLNYGLFFTDTFDSVSLVSENREKKT